MGFSNNTTEVLALYFINLITNQYITLFNENGLMFRGVMPECIFVLLGPWKHTGAF